MSDGALVAEDLRCEWAVDPIGIDASTPRLTWRVVAPDRRDVLQAAYHVEVRSGGELMADQQADGPRPGAVYAGRRLQSREACTWRVRMADQSGAWSPWSDDATFEMGLLEPSDWEAQWISPRDDAGAKERPCPLLRRTFSVDDDVELARIYVTAHGLYDVRIDGQAVTPDLLRPGWTSYGHRLQYQSYDVSGLIGLGRHVVTAELADCWWRGETTGGRIRNAYGDHLALLFQLEVGSGPVRRVVVCTDEEWRWTVGARRLADPFRGEAWDGKEAHPGWYDPELDFGALPLAPVVGRPDRTLVAQHGPSVRAVEELPVASVVPTRAGGHLIDVGRNMTGWLRLEASGQRNTAVDVLMGEVRTATGEVSTRNIRVPGKGEVQRMRLAFGEDGGHVAEPHFVTAGFRYAAVQGWLGALTTEDVRAVVVHSDTPVIGSFRCSDDRLSALHEVILRTQRSNLVEVPTDCPTREQAGWTGDLQAFLPTALFNMDMTALVERWLADLAADQRVDGLVPDIIPWVQPMSLLRDGTGSTGWGDAATLVPWALYGASGDATILERQFPSMQAWVRYLAARATRRPRRVPLWRGRPASGDDRFIVDSGFHWGDHYPVGGDSVLMLVKKLFRAPAMVATAFLAESARVVAATARVLGRDEDAAEFEQLRADVEGAFARRFIGADGRMRPDEQHAYALALAFDLLPEALRGSAVEHLVAAVRRSDDHAATGFLATPHLLPQLARHGRGDVAYDVLLNPSPPSWLSMLERGATTVWETLDAVREDGTARWRSLNHFTYGCVGEFLYRCVAGLDIREVGLGRLVIDPVFDPRITWAEARHDSIRGPCEVRWRREDARVTLDLTVPPTVQAVVAANDQVVGSGIHHFELPAS